ncbi:MAG: EAL domain-containing protein [Desulfobacter sp.]|nr:MAG: EAL domain-containing protein [Desulfobacter sp.]
MSLFKQIMMFITALLFLVLIIVFGIHFNASRNFVENDLYQRAKNSVNSLSLSLGDVSDDVYLMETTINAMFDGGHFRKIVLMDADNQVIYKTETQLSIEGVPGSFIRFLNLQSPVAEAVVSNGWNIVGSLQVQAHTGEAVIRMWDIFKDLGLSFCLIWGGCLVVSGIMLKLLLRSLDLIRAQAEAIEENRFIINPHVPFTTEFKKVALQMNKMVGTVQNNYDRSLETIKEAKRLRFRDRVTGLYNKTYFVNRIEAYMSSQEAVSRGEAALVGLDGLVELKGTAGYEISEAFIKEAAEVIETTAAHIDGQVVTRLNHTELGLILPGIGGNEAMEIVVNALAGIWEKIGADTALSDHIRISAGLAAYHYEEGASRIFSKLDYAATQAKNSSRTRPFHFREERDCLMGRQEWKALIRNTLDLDRFVFLCQPVRTGEGPVFHKEIFIAITDELGALKRAGFFMPTATELGLAQEIDRHVIGRMAGLLEESAGDGTVYSINISTDFIGKRSALIWARQFLSGHKHLADRLFFEISESALVRYPEICLDYAGLLRGMGFKLGIDNFTIGDESLAMLQQLTPAYIKSDAACLYDARDPSRSKIALGMLQTMAESLDIRLIGTRIETLDQLEDLKAAGIRYFQGDHVGGIQALEQDAG